MVYEEIPNYAIIIPYTLSGLLPMQLDLLRKTFCKWQDKPGPLQNIVCV